MLGTILFGVFAAVFSWAAINNSKQGGSFTLSLVCIAMAALCIILAVFQLVQFLA